MGRKERVGFVSLLHISYKIELRASYLAQKNNHSSFWHKSQHDLEVYLGNPSNFQWESMTMLTV